VFKIVWAKYVKKGCKKNKKGGGALSRNKVVKIFEICFELGFHETKILIYFAFALGVF